MLCTSLKTCITDPKARSKQSLMTIMLSPAGFSFLHFKGSEAEAESCALLLVWQQMQLRDKHKGTSTFDSKFY